MTPSYADKQFLIVDDFSEFRRSVKGIVQQLGGLDIDMCGTGEEAVDLCAQKRYDIILSDYNLGEGKDGQQVLEELIYLKRLKASALFIMITAENTQAMVMGALEYQPDAYITKPFNKAVLKARLDKLMEKKIALSGIDTAIEQNQLAEAIRLCDEEIKKPGKYAFSCLRTKAQLLEQRNETLAANKIYEYVCKERPLPWAMVGLARTLLALGAVDAAQKTCEDAIKQMPMLLAAHDGLAQVLLEKGETQRAQQVLSHAIKVSPKAILRQMQLGDVAHRNGDKPIAIRAYRHAVSLGRNSVYRSPDNYLRLANNLSASIGAGSPVEDKRMSDEASRALTEADTVYDGDALVKMRTTLAHGALAKRMKKEADAEQFLTKVRGLYDALGTPLTPDIAAETVISLRYLGEETRATDIVTRCRELYGDPGLQQPALAGSSDPDVQDALKKNADGVEAFREQEFDRAMQCFRQAAQRAPRNISIALNAVQALVEIYRRRSDANLLREAETYLEALAAMPADDKRYGKFQQLQRLILQLGKQNA